MEDTENRFSEVLAQLVILEERVQNPEAQSDPLLGEALRELKAVMEELQMTTEELRIQNEELEESRGVIESERRRYQDLFNFAPDGYLTSSLEGIIRDANLAAAVLLGVRQENLVGKPLILYVSHLDYKSFVEHLGRIRHTGQEQAWELVLQPRDLPPFPAAIKLAAELNGNGQPVGLRWSIHDIRDRKQAEATRWEAEKQRLMNTERLRAEKILQKQVKELTLLHAVAAAAAEFTNEEDLVCSVLRLISDTLNLDHAGALLLGWDDTSAVLPYRYYSFPPGKMDEIRLPDASLAMGVVQSGLLFHRSDVKAGEKGRPVMEKTRSVMCVPIKTSDHILGVLNLERFQPGVFQEEDESLLTSIAVQLTTGIERARLAHQQSILMATLEQRVVDRTRELGTLYEVTSLTSASLNLKRIFRGVLDLVLRALDYRLGEIYLYQGENPALYLAVQAGIYPETVTQRTVLPPNLDFVEWVSTHREPLVSTALADDPRTRSLAAPGCPAALICAPILSHGRMIGLLVIAGDRQAAPSKEEIDLLITITDHLGIVIDKDQLRKQAELVAVIKERQRLARELHDSVTQLLYSLMLFAEMARRQMQNGDQTESEATLQRLSVTAQQAVKEMRLMIFELRPDVLEREGLVAALRRRLDAVEEHAGTQVEFNLEGMDEASFQAMLPEKFQVEVYQITQEALNNILNYAAATRVSVRIKAEPEKVMVEIEDNGKGFDVGEVGKKGGLGLKNMHERAMGLGGTVSIESTPGVGTCVKLVVSLPPADKISDAADNGLKGTVFFA